MIFNLLSIIGKNLKIFGRSRMSAFIILLAPLLIVVLVGSAFSSNSLSSKKIGVFSEEYSDLTNSIVSGFSHADFSVSKFSSKDLCIDAVRSGEVHVCAIFPPKLEVTGSSQVVGFYADNSRLNIAYRLINEVDSQLSNKASQLGVTLAQDLLDALENAQKSLASSSTDINSAKSNVGKIVASSKTNVPSTDSVLAELQKARKLAENNTNIKEGIDNAISSVNDFQASSSQLSNSLSTIKTSSGDAQTSLVKASDQIDSLVVELKKVNVGDAENVVSPIKTQLSLVSDKSTNLDVLFPTLIALIIMFASIILTSNLVLAEKKSKARFRNFITPTSDVTFLLGMYITALIIVGIQLVTLFGGIFYLTGNYFLPVLAYIALSVFLSVTTFIMLGMLVGYLFKSEETAILASISIAAILMFFSNTIVPTETISGKLSSVVVYNPLVITDNLLRQMILFGTPMGKLLVPVYALIAEMLILFSLSYFSRKLAKRYV